MRKRHHSNEEVPVPSKQGRPNNTNLLSRYSAVQLSEDDEIAVSRSQVKLCQEVKKCLTPSKLRFSLFNVQRLLVGGILF